MSRTTAKQAKPKATTKPKGKAKGKGKPAADVQAKDKRESLPLHWPKGCSPKDVEKDLKEYRVFEFERRVWTVDTTMNSDGQQTKRARPCSNFTCTVNAHIINGTGAIKLISIENEAKERHTYHVNGEDLLTLPTFRKVTAGAKGNFDWSGTEQDYRNYLRYMQDHMGSGRLIRELGWQPEGMFVMCNAVLNGSVMEMDEHGCFDHQGERFYVPAANSRELQSRGSFTNARLVEFIRSEVTFEAWSKQMRIVHREHAMLATLFAIATAFRDHIFRKLSGFPLLFLYGESGSGKDQLIASAQSLFGRPQAALPLSGDNTGPGTVNMFAEFINLPLCLSEYVNTLKREKLEMIAALWDGRGRRRGTKTSDVSDYTTNSVPIDCSAFVTGNDYPNILDKLMTRFVIEEMPKDTFTPEEVKQFDILENMRVEGYSHLLAPIIAMRPQVEEHWYETHYKDAHALIDNALGNIALHGRMKRNLATLLATFLQFEDSLAFAFRRDELIKHMVRIITLQNTKRSQGSEVANFWSCFIAATRMRKLKEGEHYRMDSNVLGLFWSDVHTAYLQVHRELFNEPGLNSSTMRAKLEHHACFKGSISSLRIGNRRSSAIAFDMDKAGTNLPGLLTTVNDFDSNGEQQSPIVVDALPEPSKN